CSFLSGSSTINNMGFCSSSSSSNLQLLNQTQNQSESKKPKRSKKPNEVKSQFLKLQRRKATLFKKSSELATLCDVAVCVVYSGPNGEFDVWPEVPEKAKAILTNYRDFNAVKNSKKVKISLSDMLERRKNKLFEQVIESVKERMEEKDVKFDAKLDGLSKESLMNLWSNLDSKIQILNQRIKLLKGKAISFEGIGLSDANSMTHAYNQPPTSFVSDGCFNNQGKNPIVPTETDSDDIMELLGQTIANDNYSIIPSSSTENLSSQNSGYFENVGFDTNEIWQPDSLFSIPEIGSLNDLVPGFADKAGAESTFGSFNNEGIPEWIWQNNGGFETEDLFNDVGCNVGSNSSNFPSEIFQTTNDFERLNGQVTQTFPQQCDLPVSNWQQDQPLQPHTNLDIDRTGGF
ncbi:Agamous-like MADS-box protein, partial [Quillaja saponaria]